MSRMRILNKFIISNVAIKPSSPTPSHLKTYNLSFSDNFVPPIYVPLVFFYPYYGSSITITSHQEKATQLLKKSLSQTLTEFYPFSGKLVSSINGNYVDCNDEGVEFVEAKVSAQLSQIIDGPYKSLDLLYPTGNARARAGNSLLKVQLSYFDCGGLALAVFLSHKIGDTCSLCTFMKHWATVSLNHNHNSPDAQFQALKPHFLSFQKSACPEIILDNGNNCVTKRFIFTNSKIEQLKAHERTTKMNNNPTRVEIVNSLLYLCAVKAAKANRPRFFKPFVLIQTVNMRKRLANPLPENTIGNFSFCIQVLTLRESSLTLNSLTARMNIAKSRLVGMTISKLNRWEKLAVLIDKYIPKQHLESYTCSSLCGYPVYHIDFGWGKPTRVFLPDPDKYFILMDTPSGDGIEAQVTLLEEDMAKFQVDEQLLASAFAS